MKRVVIPELLDTDCGTPAEVAASLGDLRRINRWFGGVATTEDMIWRVARQINASSLSLLEVLPAQDTSRRPPASACCVVD